MYYRPERSMILGSSLLDFRRESLHESIDNLLTRWDLARIDAASVGADIGNFHILTAVLMRAIGMSAPEITQLLTLTNGLMPRDQQEYDALLRRTRMMGRVSENHADNITNSITRHTRTHMMESQQVFTGEASYDQQHANGWNSDYQSPHQHNSGSWPQHHGTTAGDGLFQHE